MWQQLWDFFGSILSGLQSVEGTIAVLGLGIATYWAVRVSWKTYRLLWLSLFFNQPLGSWRALGELLRCYGLVLGTHSLQSAAQVRIEVELLYPPPPPPFPRGSNREQRRVWLAYRQELRRWRQQINRDIKHIIREMQSSDDPQERPVIEVESCFQLYAVEEQISHYFEALRQLQRSEAFDRIRFYCRVRIKSGFIAPLHLLSGLLAHFDEDWKPVLDEYGHAVTRADDSLRRHEALRKLQTFQFDCWLLWGPSIPTCTCDAWGTLPAYQYGYGDENNSAPIYCLNDGMNVYLNSRFQQCSTRPDQPVPLSFQAQVEVIPRCGAYLEFKPGNAQRSLELSDLVLEYAEIQDTVGPATKLARRIYQAYLWVMFVICDESGEPLFPDEKWRGMLPFFTHANIAEGSIYSLLKEELAHKSLSAIQQLIASAPASAPRWTFRYACALDDSGCGQPLRFVPCDSPANATIRQHLIRLLSQSPEMAALRQSGRVLLPDPTHPSNPQERWEDYSACHLPDRIDEYFAHLKTRITDSPTRTIEPIPPGLSSGELPVVTEPVAAATTASSVL